MNNAGTVLNIRDNAGRRAGMDRRHYSYSGHIPERRCGIDRRTKEDRRQKLRVINSKKEETNQDKRKVWNTMYSSEAQSSKLKVKG